jgi:uncharacterized membrane protein
MPLHVRRHFTTGLLLVVPIAVTGYVLWTLFSFFDGWMQPFAQELFGRRIWGLGLLLTVLLVWITGVLSTNLAGKKLLELFDRLLENLPLVRTVYSASKQLVEAVSPGGRRAFRKVVLVEFPKKGTFALGFVTGDGLGPLPDDMISIYVPTALNPTSGFLVFARESDILDPRLSVEEGIKLVVSGGMVRPPGN